MRYGLGEKKLVELLKGESLKELLREPLDDSDEIEVDREVEDDRDDAGGVDFSTDAYDEIEAADELREESDKGIMSILSKGTLEVVVLLLAGSKQGRYSCLCFVQRRFNK